MKKGIFIGITICVFVLLSLPSINALECNTLLETRNSDNLKKINAADLFSIIEKIENGKSSVASIVTGLLVAGIALSLIIVILAIYYFSGHMEGSAESPTISFIKDDIQNTLTVTSADSNVLWSDIDIQGQCNTSRLSEYVAAGDVITECNGEIRVIHIPSNAILGIFNFS